MSEPEVQAMLTETEPSVNDWLALKSKMEKEDHAYKNSQKQFLKNSRFIEKDLVRTLTWIFSSASTKGEIPHEIDYKQLGEFLYRLHQFRFQKGPFSNYQLYKTPAFRVSTLDTLSAAPYIQTNHAILKDLSEPSEPKKLRLPKKKFGGASQKFLDPSASDSFYFVPVTNEQNQANLNLAKEACMLLPGAVCLALETMSNDALEKALQAFHQAFTKEAADARNILFGALIIFSNQVLSRKRLGSMIEPLKLTKKSDLSSESTVNSLLDDARTRLLTSSELKLITDFSTKHKNYDGISNLVLTHQIPKQISENLVAVDENSLSLLEVAVNQITRKGSLGAFTTKRQLLEAVCEPLKEEIRNKLLSAHFPKPKGLEAIFIKYSRSSPSFSQKESQHLLAKYQFLVENKLESLVQILPQHLRSVQSDIISPENISQLLGDVTEAFKILQINNVDENRRGYRQFDLAKKSGQPIPRNEKIKVKYPRTAWKNRLSALKLLRSVFFTHCSAKNFLDLALELKRFGRSYIERLLSAWLRSQMLSQQEMGHLFERVAKLRVTAASDVEFFCGQLFLQTKQYLHLAMDKLSSFPQLNDFSPLSPISTYIIKFLLISEHEDSAVELYSKMIKLDDQLKGITAEDRSGIQEEHPLSDISRVQKRFEEYYARFEKYLLPDQPNGVVLKRKVLFEFGLILLKRSPSSSVLRFMLGTDSSGRRYLETANLDDLLTPEKESPKLQEKRKALLLRCLVAKCEGRTWGQLTESLSQQYTEEPKILAPIRIRAVITGLIGDKKRRSSRLEIPENDLDYTLHELLIYHLRKSYSNFRGEALSEDTPLYLSLLKHQSKPTVIRQPSVKNVLPADLDLESAQIEVFVTKLKPDQFELLLEKIGSHEQRLSKVLQGVLLGTSVAKLNLLAAHLEAQFGQEAATAFARLLSKLTELLPEKTPATNAAVLNYFWRSLHSACRELRLAQTGYIVKTSGKCVQRLETPSKPDTFLEFYRAQATPDVQLGSNPALQQLVVQLSPACWQILSTLSITDASFTNSFTSEKQDSRVECPLTTGEFFGVDSIKKHVDAGKVKQIDLVIKLLRKTSRYAYGVLLKELHKYGLLIKYLPLFSQICQVKSAWDSVLEDPNIATEVLEGLLTRLRGVTSEDSGLFQLNRFEKPVFREDVIGGPVNPPAEISSSMLVPGYTYLALFAITLHPDLNAANSLLEFARNDSARSASYLLGVQRLLLSQPSLHPKISELHEHLFKTTIGPCTYHHYCWLLPELDINKIIRAEFGDAHVTLSDPAVSKHVLKALSSDESITRGYVRFVKLKEYQPSRKTLAAKENLKETSDGNLPIRLKTVGYYEGQVDLNKTWYRIAAKETLDRELDFNDYMRLINYTLELTKDAQFKFSSYQNLKPFECEIKHRDLFRFKIEVSHEAGSVWDEKFDVTLALKFTHNTYPVISSMCFNASTPIPQAEKKLHSSFYKTESLAASLQLLSYRTAGYLTPAVLNKYFCAPQEAFYPKNMLAVPRKIRRLFRFRFDVDGAVDFYNQMDFREALLLNRVSQVLEMAENDFVMSGDDSDPLIKHAHLLGGSTISEITKNCYQAVENKRVAAAAAPVN